MCIRDRRGEVALYPASCYGLPDVEERVSELARTATVLVVRLIPTARSFSPGHPVVDRERLYGVSVAFTEALTFTLGGGSVVLADGGGRPLATRSGGVVALPFGNVLQQLPLEAAVRMLERAGLPEPLRLGPLSFGPCGSLPLAFNASSDLFSAACAASGRAFVEYRAERGGIVIAVREGERVARLYATVPVEVKAAACDVVHGSASRRGDAWLLTPGEYVVRW